MRTVHIKYNLPYNWGAIRKLGLYFDSLPKQTIMPNQNRSFKIDNTAQSLKIKLDYWRSKIEIPESDEELYITISMKGESPIQWTLHSFTRGALSINLVSQPEFDAFDNHYAQTNVPIKNLDSVSFVLTAGVTVYMMYKMFSVDRVSEDTSQLIWATFILVATMLLVMWKDRKRLSKSSYKSRMILNSIFLFMVVVSLSVQGFLSLGWIVALLPLTVLMRTIVYENEQLNRKPFVN